MCKGKKCATCEHRDTCTGCPDRFVFSDIAIFDRELRTLTSVRDGIYEYLGLEIGQKPPHKVFQVYRSPETIKKLAALLEGIPITDGHVDIDKPAEKVVSHVEDTSLMQNEDEELASTIVIKNKVADSDSVVNLIEQGNKELSLAGRADLIDHDIYDFEQVEIEPHHIAILERGRCGTACRFIDQQPDTESNEMKKFFKLFQSFKDQEGEVTLQMIMEMVAALPDAIKSVPMEELNKLVPALQEVISAAKEVGADVPEEQPIEDADDNEEMEDADPEKAEAARGSTALGDLIERERGDVTNAQIAEAAGRDQDTIENIIAGNIKTPPREVLAGIGRAINVSLERLIEALPDDKEDEVEVEDQEEPTEEEKVAMADGVVLFSDAQVKEIAAKAVEQHSAVIERARKFVDESFDFSGKSTQDIQREVLAMHTDQTFEDAELDVAFKMLQTTSGQYKEFGDASPEQELDKLKDKEI